MAYQSEIEKLEQRYRENPEQWFAALADSYRKAGNLDLALDVVQAGLEKRPNYVSGHIVLGRCLLQKPDDQAAAAAFERVLALDAENVIALKALSEIAERSGRPDEARRWLTRLLEVDPMNEEAQQALERLGPSVPAAAAGAAAEAAAPAGPVPAAEAQPAAAGAAEPGAMAAPAVESAGAGAVAEAETAAVRGAAAEEFTIEKSEEGALKDLARASQAFQQAETALPVESLPALGLEPAESGAPGAPAPLADLEPAALQPEDLAQVEAAPPPDLPLVPFDDQLAWGTGERVSRQIGTEDLQAALQAHEESLDQPAHALPGLEAAEVPPVGVEERSPPTDLPLIYPEELAAGPAGGTAAPPAVPAEAGSEAEATGGPEPEPVVTETMAELYAQQGMMSEARGIYQKLLEQRPGDAALAGRLAALESGGLAGPAVAEVESSGTQPGVARPAQAGRESVREFLAALFGPGAEEASAEESGGAVPLAAAPGPALEAPSPLEAAFGELAPEPVPGAPTRPAGDEVSLAAVFGEEPVPPAPPAGGSAPVGRSSGSGFSFDEFFGGQSTVSGSPGGATGPAPAADEEDDEFKRWLKGLKS